MDGKIIKVNGNVRVYSKLKHIKDNPDILLTILNEDNTEYVDITMSDKQAKTLIQNLQKIYEDNY